MADTAAAEAAAPEDVRSATIAPARGTTDPQEPVASDVVADVTRVQTTGAPGAYTFSVTVESPDTGCQQYADWWEVVSKDGELLYRRVLLHSHVDEQPFTRSGGPVDISAEQEVWVRAHMQPHGYGGISLLGSVARSFAAGTPNFDDAALSTADPLPTGCAF